jgi:hypothetical protein
MMQGKRLVACLACSGAIAAICWNLALDGRCAALPHDPTLAASPLEAVWALVAWPIARLLGLFPLEPWYTSLTLAAVALLAGVFVSTWEVKARRILPLLLSFVFFTWILIRVLGAGEVFSGPDAFAFSLVLLAYSSFMHQGGHSLRFFAFVSGVLASSGSLYLLLLAKPFRSIKRESLTRGAGVFFALGAVFGILGFLLVRSRYPNPLVPPSAPVLVEWAQTWLVGESILMRTSETSGHALFFAFPGAGLLLGWILSHALVRFCRLLWDLSAGRTVPVQLALLGLPGILVLAIALFAVRLPKSPILEARFRQARSLVQMVPSRTTIFAPEGLFGIGAYLQSAEEGRQDVVFRCGSRARWANHLEANANDCGTRNRQTTAYSTGENWVEMAGERISFSPHYLLNATTEVYSATPCFFIGNNPASATGGPRLFVNGRPFQPSSYPDLAIQEWGYNGESFQILRTRDKGPWHPLEGEWTVDYLGFMLEKDFEKWGDFRLPRHGVAIEDLYK